MKTCSKCKKEKSLEEFGLSKRHKDGRLNSCKICQRKMRSDYFEKNPKARLKKKKREAEWKVNNKDKVLESNKRYRERNKKYLDQKHKEYVKNNPEKVREAKKKYEEKNPHIRAKIKTKRRQKERKAVPEWADHKKINEVYKKAKWLESLTGLKYHVDHIVPIQGKNVCGLHVWANLQILEASLNCSKGNKHG